METITRWEFYKKNYLGTSFFMVMIFILALFLSLYRNDEEWYFSFFFLMLGVLVVPIASNISYRKKFRQW